jgi:predicted transcriptional regulator
MILPCEVAIKYIIPTVRAMITKELIQTHKLKQNDVAKILGITQAAVSQYVRNMRGKYLEILNTKEVQITTAKIAIELNKNKIPRSTLTIKFCQICKTIRAKKLVCDIHKRLNLESKSEACEICAIPNKIC